MKKQIKFRGIDNFNRPVFKVIDKNEYYGSVVVLRDYDADPKEVSEYFKERMHELEYFGTHFNCEPHGGMPNNITLEIVE